MRIVHIISNIDATVGGPVFALMGLAKAQLTGADAHVTIAPGLPPGVMPQTIEQLRSAGVDVVPIRCGESPLGNQTATRQQLRPLIERSDVVHIFGLWEGIQHEAAALCREMHKPHIFEPCGMLDAWSLKRKWLKKKLYMLLRLRRDLNESTAIHVSTTWERDQTARLGLKPPLIVVPAGVELSEFAELPQKGNFRRRHPALEHKPLIVFLGRVFPGKGLEMLIPAMAKMKNQSAMLAVVGPDPVGYAARMQALISELRLEQRVLFTGMARGTERIEALVDADLFSLPSEHENFGVAVLEALAAGTPAIVSDQVGLCHDIASAQAGQAVPLNPDRLAESLDAWLADEPRRREAGARGRAMAFERFTWDHIARQWNEIYQSLQITPANP